MTVMMIMFIGTELCDAAEGLSWNSVALSLVIKSLVSTLARVEIIHQYADGPDGTRTYTHALAYTGGFTYWRTSTPF